MLNGDIYSCISAFCDLRTLHRLCAVSKLFQRIAELRLTNLPESVYESYLELNGKLSDTEFKIKSKTDDLLVRPYRSHFSQDRQTYGSDTFYVNLNLHKYQIKITDCIEGRVGSAPDRPTDIVSLLIDKLHSIDSQDKLTTDFKAAFKIELFYSYAPRRNPYAVSPDLINQINNYTSDHLSLLIRGQTYLLCQTDQNTIKVTTSDRTVGLIGRNPKAILRANTARDICVLLDLKYQLAKLRGKK